jgi:formate hydrogenlyase subunit 4
MAAGGSNALPWVATTSLDNSCDEAQLPRWRWSSPFNRPGLMTPVEPILADGVVRLDYAVHPHRFLVASNPFCRGRLLVTARDILLQIAQVLVTLLFAPLLQGVILQFEERVQRNQGPGIFQPYRDLWKLFHKQIVAPETASWLYWAAPIVAFTTTLTVPILIPVLTNYPLPLSDMGDILGGGLILTLGSFMITLAGLDTQSAYGGIGSSRAVMVAILAEPTLILVFVGITLLAKSMLPFVVNHLLVAQPWIYWGPTHLFLVAAFFVLILVETDRLPIHSSTHIEVYMIEEARILEYSGPMLAILRWASMMKQFILYTIFCNVLLFPWALSRQGAALGVIGSAGALALKFFVVACVVVLVETVQSRLRFYRYQEPLAASFLLAILAIVGTQLS